MPRLYYKFSDWLKENFQEKVYKISIDAGFSCPNKDGTKSSSSCIFCRRESILPSYLNENLSIKEQIKNGIERFKKTNNANKFLSYLQPNSNTYGDLAHLKKIYEEAIDHCEIFGLSISTRPDCINEPIVKLISEFNEKKLTMVELGLQSVYDRSLEFLNRAHMFQTFLDAVNLLKKYNIKIIAHIIIGLPNESIADIIEEAKILSRLNIFGVKIHHFHVVKETTLEILYNKGKIKLLNLEEYIEYLVNFIANLDENITIHRLLSSCKRELLIAPHYNLGKFKFLEKFENELLKRNLFQGKNYKTI
jgi:radical SAM protein (TIGR01212 family)